MTDDALAQDVSTWVTRLSEPREEFAGFSACPFAKGARIILAKCADFKAAETQISELDPSNAILVIDLPPRLSSAAKEFVERINGKLKKRDLFALVSDPQNPVVVDGYRTTQEGRLFIIVQRYEELQQAALALEAHGYYRRWDKDTLERVRKGR